MAELVGAIEPIGPFADIGGRVAEVLDDVRAYARGPIRDLERPLPAGTDYHPVPFFFHAARPREEGRGTVRSFAGAIHAIDLAYRAIAALMDLEDHPAPRRSEDARPDGDPRREAGERLLVADGLIILAHRLLGEMDPLGFQTLSPLFVEGLERIPPRLETAAREERGIEVHRELCRLGVSAAEALAAEGGELGSTLRRVLDTVDDALTTWRESDDSGVRTDSGRRLERLAGSLAAETPGGRHLVPYVTLVRKGIEITSGP